MANLDVIANNLDALRIQVGELIANQDAQEAAQADDVRQKCNQLQKGEMETKSIILRGLLPEIKAFVTGHQPETLDDLEAKVRLAESIESMKPKPNFDRVNMMQEAYDKNLGDLSKSISNLQETVRQQNRNIQFVKNNIRRWEPSTRDPMQQPGFGRGFKPFCQRCRRQGHTTDNCVRRQQSTDVTCYNYNQKGSSQKTMPYATEKATWEDSQWCAFKLPRGIPEWGCETPNLSLDDNDSPVDELFQDTSDECLLTKNNNIKGLNFVQILLQDSSLYALVDTGSTISLAGQELFDMFLNLIEQLQDYKGTAKNVCSQEFQFDGEVPVTFDLAGHTFTVSLKYLKNMPYAVLSGTDFLQTVGAQLDFKNGIMVVPNSYKVGSKYHCLLEPGQESMVMALIPSPPIFNASAIIEFDKNSKYLRVAPSIVRISSGNMEIPLTIVN